MKKYIIYGIVLIIVIGLFIGLNYLLKPNMNTQIKKYLMDNGFIESEYENLLVNEESESKKRSFSLGDYTYMLNVDEENEEMNTSLNATYSYKTEDIIYSYRVNYDNSLNVYFKGTYNKDNFTCEKEFSNATLSDNDKENICSLAKINLKIFDLEAKTLFSKYKYIDYIKNK